MMDHFEMTKRVKRNRLMEEYFGEDVPVKHSIEMVGDVDFKDSQPDEKEVLCKNLNQ